jgi:hypothetical protein
MLTFHRTFTNKREDFYFQSPYVTQVPPEVPKMDSFNVPNVSEREQHSI